MKKYLILCIWTFLLLKCRSINFLIIITICFVVYQFKTKYFTKKYLVLLIFFYINSINPYTILNQCVLETHENYVIASINHKKVLIYTDELYFFGEKITTLYNEKEISSLSNFNLFDFESYMHQLNIETYYDSSDVVIQKGNSLQRKMYKLILNYKKEISDVLIKIFYQFDTKNFIYSSGLHYSYLNQVISNLFLQNFNILISYGLSSVVLLLFGVLFPFKFAFLRILIGNIVKIFFKDYSAKDKLGIQYMICMFIYPSCVHSLSFLIPFFLSLNYHFIIEKKYQKISSILLLIFIQFKQFNQCQVLSVLIFPFFQKLNSIYFIFGFIQLFHRKINFLQYLELFAFKLEKILNDVVFYGSLPLVIFLLFLYAYFKFINQNKKYLYVCLLLLIYVPLQSYLSPFYEIHFINVGQGDSIFIQSPFNINNVLIDIPKNKESIIIDTLHAKGINRIDTLILSHNDSDHDGGKDELIKQFKVNKIIDQHQDIPFLNQMLYDINSFEYENKNDNSLVYAGKIGTVNVCLMADVSKSVEVDIINKYEISCDILKVGHHGSRTSTDPYFIQAIKPKLAVISVGENNYYGHPHDEVIKILERYGAKIYQTSQGAVSIKSFLNINFIATSTHEFGIMISE